MTVIKRDGKTVPFDQAKIWTALTKASSASRENGGKQLSTQDISNITQKVEERCIDLGRDVEIEEIQDMVEDELAKEGFFPIARLYRSYRESRARLRKAGPGLMDVLHEIMDTDAIDSDRKRENANINGDTAMGTMLQIGSASSKVYAENYLLRPEHANAFREGDIHIHDFDFYALTATCCQIDLLKLFHGGFSTGHGYLREPQSIRSYASLAAIAIQSDQNDQHETYRAA